MAKKRKAQDNSHEARPEPATPATRESWLRAKGPALRFVLISAGFMLFFYGVFYTSPEDSPRIDALVRAYLNTYAVAARAVLHVLGFDASVLGSTILVDKRGVDVVRGCDAMEPIALYVAAVIAIQVPWRAKLAGLVIGVPVLVLVNLVRIVALTIVSVKFHEQFDTAHLTVGQTLYVVCTLALWFAWVAWATRERRRKVGVAAG